MDRITFEEKPEWLKMTLPERRNWLSLFTFSAALLAWVGMLGWIVYFLATERAIHFVLFLLLLLWLAVWLWFGRFLWTRWQYYAADREILFINAEQLIVRRPVSILGITDNYDMRYVSSFYYSDKHNCPAFDYAFQHVYFGHHLTADEAQLLIAELNGRYFPDDK
jgi:hypothetical protein